MDLEKLRGTAVSVAQQNIRQHEADQRRSTERAEAVARLDEAMQAREEAFRGLVSIAVHCSAGIIGDSMAIPVGRVLVQAPSGEAKERNLFAFVRNDNRLVSFGNENPSVVAQESIIVSFSVEAEQSDVESGLFSTNTEIGWLEADGEAKMLYGQELDRETYELSTAPIPESLRTSPTINSTTALYAPDTCDKQNADWYLIIVNSQLSTMRETLDLLHAGIQQTQSAATK